MNLPEEFVQCTSEIIGEEWNDFLSALNREPSISVRVNSSKLNSLPFKPIPWSANAYQLNKRPQFTLDPLIHAGAYYVQEANSMFVEEALRQTIDISKAQIALDLCAAPGGKTTLISSLLSENSLVVANEVIKARAGILKENVQKWGKGNVVVTSNDAKDFGKLNSFFDLIVADLPCSGEGMFRKDPKAVEEWSLNNVNLCAERQKRIVASVWPSLKEGGVFLYSTCTYNRDENENNIQWILENFDAELLPLKINDEWGIVSSGKGYRFYPHRTPGEGFFISVVRKKGNFEENRGKKNFKKDFSLPSKKEKEIIESFLKPNLEYLKWRTFLFAFQFSTEKFMQVAEALYVLHLGVEVGELIRDDLKPSPTIVYSNFISKNSFEFLELNQLDALKFLKRENIILPSGAKKDWLIFTFKKVNIGLAKNIGNRINNYFPKEWVIRMAIPSGELETLG